MNSFKIMSFLWSFLLILFCIKPTTAQNSYTYNMRLNEVEQVLKQSIPVILAKGIQDKKLLKAQELFLNDSRVAKYYIDKDGNKILNEIFGIFLVRESDIYKDIKACTNGECFRIEMYNYVFNETIIGFVNMAEEKVITINKLKNVQPDLPPHLVNLAVEIAYADEEVKKELLLNNINTKPLMAGTKTALNKTHCQRSQHLCVAPTFISGSSALWVIVDLTYLKVVGIKWTNTGENEYNSERSVQNHKIMSCFCDITNKIEKLGWSFDYSMTRSDGLKVSNILYHGTKIVKSIKLVDWHVNYSNVEGFGYADAVGCPEYSTAAVHAVEVPRMEWIVENNDTIGFKLIQEYYSEGWPAPCNYNYYQSFDFYKDGSFRPIAGSVGRGCGINGVYKPITRISLGEGFTKAFEFTSGNTWKKWKNEGWLEQNDTINLNHQSQWLRFKSSEMTYAMIPNMGQFGKTERGDNAFVYLTKFKETAEEGESDLPAIGTCCNLDFRQGPENFIESIPEEIDDHEMVIWYVPKLTNDNTPGKEYCWAEMKTINGVLKPLTFPCLSGPLFKIVENEK